MSTTEANKHLVRRYFEETFNTGKDSRFDEFFARDFVDHNGFPGQIPGPQGVREGYRLWCLGFPDTHATIEDIIAEGDKVVIRTTGRGTHLGEFQGVAPTGKSIEIGAISIFRVVEGKIKERWGLTEAAGLADSLREGTPE